ncbi:MAG: hypothetical protein R3D58_13320 [Saprospiraceae bacterium]
MIFQHSKIHKDYHLKCVCVACYDREILSFEDHVFAISCCIANLIQDARDRGVAVEPIIREYLDLEPEPGLTPAQVFDTAITQSDAWSHVSNNLREAWQGVTKKEMQEYYKHSMKEGIENLPNADGLPFGDEEFDCMTFEEWIERLSESVDMV